MKIINYGIREDVTIIIPVKGKSQPVEFVIPEYPIHDDSCDFTIDRDYKCTVTATTNGTEYEIEVFKTDDTEVEDFDIIVK